MVTLEQTVIWTCYTLLGAFALGGYIIPAAILLGKWMVNRGWQSEDADSIRVSLLSIWESWRTAFSYLFVFQTMAMALVWTLSEVSTSHTYAQISKIAAGNLGLAAPAAVVLTYTILEGVNGIMVSWAFYQELRRREEARKEAEIQERIEAEVQTRLATEIEARREAETEERIEAEVQRRVKAELERMRNGSAE